MAKPAIHFFTEEISYSLKKKTLLKTWIKSVIETEGYQLRELNFILCSDEYLLRINQDYLNHDTYTDVITFDNSEELKTIVGDIFISVERINENAITLKVPPFEELCRVMIHGTLHLLGYLDKGKAAKTLMTSKEDQYLESARSMALFGAL
jgi:probable rRNA maturation factor